MVKGKIIWTSPPEQEREYRIVRFKISGKHYWLEISHHSQLTNLWRGGILDPKAPPSPILLDRYEGEEKTMQPITTKKIQLYTLTDLVRKGIITTEQYDLAKNNLRAF